MKLLGNYLVIALVAITFSCCNTTDNNSTKAEPIVAVAKTTTADPFKNDMVESQQFTVDTKQDNVIEGKNGTLVIIPKGAFINSKGETVTENVKVELSEALTLDDMILSNLTTTAGGKPLQTGGMVYINAFSASGEQLKVNSEIPLSIQVPTPRRVPGMMIFDGVRDSLGNMNWINPAKPENYLITVDLNKLDFLPKGFVPEVTLGMPFRGHKSNNDDLNDSLYYSLSGRRAEDYQYINEATKVYIPNEPVINTAPENRDHAYTHSDTAKRSACGIDPAIIKTIKTHKFENTLIATREFEKRLQLIFKTCKKEVLELYINNTDKNMYEVDSMAALKMKGTSFEKDFNEFKKLRHGKVKNGDRHAKILRDFYTKKLDEVKKKLDEATTRYLAELKKKTDDFTKVDREYRGLLIKRELYRMESYNFKVVSLGWKNIDLYLTGLEPITVQVNVPNAKQFDRVYTYVIFSTKRSLLRLNTTDTVTFYSGTLNTSMTQLMPVREKSVAITIGYKGDEVYFGLTEFTTVTDKKLNISPILSNKKDFKQLLKKYDSYLSENSLSVELDYMVKYYNENLRLKKLAKENDFMLKLWRIAYPCCEVPKVEFNH